MLLEGKSVHESRRQQQFLWITPTLTIAPPYIATASSLICCPFLCSHRCQYLKASASNAKQIAHFYTFYTFKRLKTTKAVNSKNNAPAAGTRAFFSSSFLLTIACYFMWHLIINSVDSMAPCCNTQPVSQSFSQPAIQEVQPELHVSIKSCSCWHCSCYFLSCRCCRANFCACCSKIKLHIYIHKYIQCAFQHRNTID